jgi:hypothetical protein
MMDLEVIGTRRAQKNAGFLPDACREQEAAEPWETAVRENL